MPNYQEIEKDLIPNRKSFRHPSMHATNTGTYYDIYSYSTKICEIDLVTGQIWIDETKYSVTTSKQQNLVKRALGVK